MKSLRTAITEAAAACILSLGAQWAVAAGPAALARQALVINDVARLAADAPLIDDVEAAFARIQVRGEHLTARSNGFIPKPRYRTSFSNLFGLRNHFQGIQRVPGSDYVVMSGANHPGSVSELFVIRLGHAGGREESQGREVAGAGDVVARVVVDDVMWHAGGLSMFGTTLAVPVHGGTPRRAKVVFFDLSDPQHPRRLPIEIDRPGRKASATAVTRLANGHFVAAVLSAYDGLPRRIDFYLSRTDALDDGFLPQAATWRVSDVQARPGQERTFSHFQGINFIRQSDGRLFMVGFHNSFAPPSILPGRDYADLYEVVFPEDTIDAPSPGLATPAIIKTANRLLYCTGGYCNLDAAAGLFIDPETQSFSVYAAPGWLDGDTLKMTVYQSSSGPLLASRRGP